MSAIIFYNTLTKKKEPFIPYDSNNIRMYVCGPTVYDLIHLGNARPIVTFDVVARLIKQHYGNITYIRNITDIDDKINNRALELNESINSLTSRTIEAFHSDIIELGTQLPNVEPKVTDHIPEIIDLIERLIKLGHAYEIEGHVLFEVRTNPTHGILSGNDLDTLRAGARVEIAPYKRDQADFILWKPSSELQPGWFSPWGFGRPGWHAECSAMSRRYLGENFDIHGGGSDLIFPHHENEIAQSTCAFPGSKYATTWIHNGMITVNGEKMSKSLGNFFTVRDLLKIVPGEAIRLLILKTHYRSTLDFSIEKLQDAKKELDRFYRALQMHEIFDDYIPGEVFEALRNDLNIPQVITYMHDYANTALAGDSYSAIKLLAAGKILGLFQVSSIAWFQRDTDIEIDEVIAERNVARAAKDFKRADEIRAELLIQGIVLEDTANGTNWRRK